MIEGNIKGKCPSQQWVDLILEKPEIAYRSIAQPCRTHR